MLAAAKAFGGVALATQCGADTLVSDDAAVPASRSGRLARRDRGSSPRACFYPTLPRDTLKSGLDRPIKKVRRQAAVSRCGNSKMVSMIASLGATSPTSSSYSGTSSASQIAALKRQIAALEKQLARVQQSDSQDAAQQAKALEQQIQALEMKLAQLEAQRGTDSSNSSTSSNSSSSAGTTETLGTNVNIFA